MLAFTAFRVLHSYECWIKLNVDHGASMGSLCVLGCVGVLRTSHRFVKVALTYNFDCCFAFEAKVLVGFNLLIWLVK